MAELVTLAFGPHFVIGEEFRSLNAVAVAIYGSWAARSEAPRVIRRATSTFLSSVRSRAATCMSPPSVLTGGSGYR